MHMFRVQSKQSIRPTCGIRLPSIAKPSTQVNAARLLHSAQLLAGQRGSPAHLRVRVRELAEVMSSCNELVVGAGGGDAAALQHDHQVRTAEMLHLTRKCIT